MWLGQSERRLQRRSRTTGGPTDHPGAFATLGLKEIGKASEGKRVLTKEAPVGNTVPGSLLGEAFAAQLCKTGFDLPAGQTTQVLCQAAIDPRHQLLGRLTFLRPQCLEELLLALDTMLDAVGEDHLRPSAGTAMTGEQHAHIETA